MEGARERLARLGAEALSDAELLAVLFGTGTPKEQVLVLATRILATHGGMTGLDQRGLGELLAIDGIGFVKACRIMASLELGRRAIAPILERKRSIVSSRDVADALRPRLGPSDTERFYAVPLDVRNRPLAELEIAIGGPASCPVAPADLFRCVLREAASGLIVAHNHPSGDPMPSTADIAFTTRIEQASELLGLPLLDHVIVTRDAHFSFKEHGLLSDRSAP